MSATQQQTLPIPICKKQPISYSYSSRSCVEDRDSYTSHPPSKVNRHICRFGKYKNRRRPRPSPSRDLGVPISSPDDVAHPPSSFLPPPSPTVPTDLTYSALLGYSALHFPFVSFPTGAMDLFQAPRSSSQRASQQGPNKLPSDRVISWAKC